MSGVLQSLLSPLDMRDPLPTTVCLRKDLTQDPATGGQSYYWSPTTQYFTNDVVIDPITDGAYIMWGGQSALTGIVGVVSTRGGDEPSLNPDLWKSMSAYAAASYGSLLAVTSAAQAGTAFALTYTGGTDPVAITDLYDATKVLVTVQGTIAANAGADAVLNPPSFTVSGSSAGAGYAGGVSPTVTLSPTFAVLATGSTAATPFSVSFMASVGTTTVPDFNKTLTLTASAPTGAGWAAFTNLYVTWVPVL